MKQVKQKECSNKECKALFYPRTTLDKYCSPGCFYPNQKKKEKKVYKIPKKSVKRTKQDKVYLAKRIVFLKENEYCAVYPSNKATEVHHVRGRLGSRYLDESNWLAVSREGHVWIHDNVKESYDLGFLKKRTN